MTFADIDAIVIGKAPDALEGVMMPELSLADALGAVGKPIHRVHTAGSVGASTAMTRRDHGRVGSVRPGAGGLLREAVRGQRHVGAVGRPLGRSGRGRHLRPVDPQLHLAVGCARAHRVAGRGEGPAERAEEPERPPAHRGHLDREGEGVPDAVGAAPLPRVVPVVRRRGRDRARQRGRGQGGAARSRRGSSPTPSAPSSARSPGATRCKPQAGVDCSAALYRKAGITDPLRADRLRRALRAVLAGTSPCGSRATTSRPRARGGS